jgi:sporulation protein YlmC with PRC-barrel domain
MNYLQQDPYGMYRHLSHQGPGPFLMGANTLIGNEVYNLEDDHLGEIKEIMLETATGNVAYAVLQFGGVFGMGDKLFAVPWSALKLDTEKKCFVLDADKESLKDAPGFDQDDWPMMADRKWGSQVHDYYGVRPYWDQ